MAKLAVVENDPGAVARPRIITALGKQGGGKTLLLRYLIERGVAVRSRPLKLLDADPHNGTLRQHYADAETPGSSSTEDRRVSLEQAVRNQHAAARDGSLYDALWDIGGGDLLMARLARRAHFTETLERVGVDLIVFYLLSPEMSDLEYFQGLEDAGFKPRNLALVFNAGRIQGDRRADRAFDATMKSALVHKLVERGARPLFMPALESDCMKAADETKESTFRAALSKLDMWHEIYLRSWLDEAMEEQIAKPLIEWGWLA
jgi:hypothetical protein